MTALNYVSTGLAGLDQILQGLRLGDNVVWQVDDLNDYRRFVAPYLEKAKADGRRIVYIRFAQHPPVIADDPGVKKYQLDASTGFESFSKQVHDIVTKEGAGAFYIFDCLSDLLSAWATDLMIGNFFLVTCPYLFKLDTLAYFAILRNNHSYKTIARIRETTQLLIDVYDFDGHIYVHPLKVWNRYSPTMFLPHTETDGKFLPITNSVDATRLFSHMADRGEESARRNLDYWDRLFLEAEELAKEKDKAKEKEKALMRDKLIRIMLVREPRMLKLVQEYITLEDLLEIKARMIGTGFIGGKALGMLLARNILGQAWAEILEPHDSFFIGSDVFYSYIVENGWWDLWLEQKTEAGFFSKAADLKDRLQNGKFPDEIKEQFNQLLEYFGQSPIIVRSSSLLEDGFGNAFAGKYESIFCVNQGTPDVRYANFEKVVRRVFASTMNEDALTYRLQRGMAQQDEQMALLVQRVSGTHYRQSFLPYLAGVGVSYNTFVWHEAMDPKAGMLRLVFGLGTRAVNRVEGDYPRIIALDKPLLRPYAGTDIKKYSQHDVDLLNITTNELQSVPLPELVAAEPEIKLDLIGKKDGNWTLTFDRLLAETEFTKRFKELLAKLDETYRYPVDVEFTVNFTAAGRMRINLLQCRPLQAKGPGGRVQLPARIEPDKLFFQNEGNFMGGSVDLPLKKVIFVEPKAYSELLHGKKYTVARLIGKLNRRIKEPTMLIGPGRWGTRDATLGVPVSFAEINNFAALVEVADPAIGFNPELSFGSHFFLDLVEANIFYAALFAGLDARPLARRRNLFKALLPDESEYEKVIKVYDLPLRLMSDLTAQRVVCLLDMV
ncbi:MAG TPA: PEP/pyruvate-binding domain-containing protein [Candidatus Sulfotelmatobacter sp.]|nr:PEP/pyruvate-binding domain-containing protein [Candidatus Sulfotelmatobacter sp.]